MLSWMIAKKIEAFEKNFKFYDTRYLKELLAVSPRALITFYKATSIGNYRESIPLSAAYVAKIIATRHEDCGPCSQLVVTMAERDGISASLLEALIQKQYQDLPCELCDVALFCEAVLARELSADVYRQKIVAAYGKKGLVSIAFALLAARLYPTLKYALGHGRTCSVVNISGQSHPMSREVM